MSIVVLSPAKPSLKQLARRAAKSVLLIIVLSTGLRLLADHVPHLILVFALAAASAYFWQLAVSKSPAVQRRLIVALVGLCLARLIVVGFEYVDPHAANEAYASIGIHSIGAFPSQHMAQTAAIVLCGWCCGPGFRLFALGYATAVAAGLSVFLGERTLDLAGGAAFALAAWWLGLALLRWQSRERSNAPFRLRAAPTPEQLPRAA